MNPNSLTARIAALQKALAAAIENGDESLAGDLSARIALLSAPVTDALKDANA